jgi:CRISPR-associated protein Csm4
MRTYEIQLSIPTGYITPWHADTIFGHLCWVAERHDGFEGFSGAAGLIDLYRHGDPPLILSDAFPKGYLPAPANLRELFEREDNAGLDAKRYSLLKSIRKASFITVDQFKSYQRGEPFNFTVVDDPYVSCVTLHNQINRFSNTTGDEGNLFELDERFVRSGEMSMYARVEDGFEADAKRLFELFAAGGFGKKKSTGKGAFTISGFEEFHGFDGIEAANGFVSLSHFVPTQADPTEGAYKTVVKYGKMGEEKALGGNPFKKPLLMVRPGAVFRTETPKQWYGRLIDGISYSDPHVVHYAYAFSVPVCI